MNPSIFKAYDIRGEYPQEFNEDAAYAIARAAALFIKGKKLLVAMDNRISSPQLKAAVLKGLSEEGVEVLDPGVTTTPMFYFAVNKEKADGGLMITASHNPPKYNGLKIVREEARPIGENSGLLEIKQKALAGDFGLPKTKGAYSEKNYFTLYTDFLAKGIVFPRIRLVVDAACGSSGALLTAITEKNNVSIIPLCFGPCAQQTHEGNPMLDENVRDLSDAVRKNKTDLGVAFDGDGDRVFFFDERGVRIPTYAVAALIASRFLTAHPKSTVITDVRMPLGLSDAVSKQGGICVLSRVGHVFIKQEMRRANAIFGAEVSGHFYFRDFFYSDSGLYMLMRILDVLGHEQKHLSELVKPFLSRFQSGELNFKVQSKEKAIAALGETFVDGRHAHIDGLTVRYPDWWFNVRASNTEPFLRVNIEANTEMRLEEVRNQIETILK